MTVLPLFLLALLSGVALAQNRNIFETAVANPDLTLLVDLLIRAGLDDVLSGPGPFTVLAPTDEAIRRLPPDAYEKLRKTPYKDVLSYILEYHVANGAVRSTDLRQGQQIPTLNGEKVNVTRVFPRVVFNENSVVTSGNIVATNGIIHIVDNVLLPENVGLNSNLYQALQGLNESLLLTCTKLCGLDSALQSDGPFTIFAPSNRAFENLGPELQRLLQNTSALCPIIAYHVVSGAVPATALPDGQSFVPSLTGVNLSIDKSSDAVVVNCNSGVISANNVASNGVIHQVDHVILPPTKLIVPT